MTLGEFIKSLIGDQGIAALAGAAGGVVRWLTLRSRLWPDGVISIVVGGLSALYLGPLAQPAIEALLGGVIGDEASRQSFSGFILGIGGISVSGFVMDFWERGHKRKGQGDGDDAK